MVKNPPAMQRPGFDPWVGKIPWRREWLPTPVFWPGEFHELYSSWGHKESDTTERLSLFSYLVFPVAFLYFFALFIEEGLLISPCCSLELCILLGIYFSSLCFSQVMTNLDSILKSRDITLPTKVRLVNAVVFPVVVYGCESWTVKKA